MSKEMCFDATIIGAGVTGLMLTKKLSEIGMKVALVEKEEKFASGPSTRNEGWLHRGTYHATSIVDKDLAMQVARRCIYGHEEIRRYAPEAIEEPDSSSYALVKNQDKVDDVLDRWDSAGVVFSPIDKAKLAMRLPEVRLGSISKAFEVADVSVNTRILYRKLLFDAEKAGSTHMPSARLSFDPLDPQKSMLIRNDGDKQKISSSVYIHANGYGMKEEFEEQFGVEIPLRYWKSHLLLTQRLTSQSVFCIDPNEAAMINHGDISIVGMNEDAVEVAEPDYVPISEKVTNIIEATQRLFSNSEGKFAKPVACVKVDVADSKYDKRSLGLKIFEPITDHICVLPGKMTEAPYTTDAMVRIVYDRLDGDGPIALRPMDRITLYQFPQKI